MESHEQASDVLTELQHEALPEQFALFYQNAYARILWNNHYRALIIEALNSYIPMEEFQNTFNKATDLIHQESADKVIFDKRNLRTFHQPSMEWYFITWKIDIYKKYGVRKHVKLLPDLPWFKKAVEAGKSEIFNKYGESSLDQLTIDYEDDIKAALKQ